MFATSITHGVQNSRELQRILALPRRVWSEDPDLVREMTSRLRRPGGTMTLFPIQAQSLFELWCHGSLFAPIATGAGKTLISLLAPYVLAARRPLLLLPANLIPKTHREANMLSSHWPIPNYTRFLSWELLSRTSSHHLLEEYRPDLIIGDECHFIMNPDAAVTKRVNSYQKAFPTRILLMTGTLTKDSIKNFASFCAWCLGAGSPLPLSKGDLDEWADAIDDKVPSARRRPAGYLRQLMNDEERANPDELQAVRTAFRRRLVETPGIVATGENEIGASLSIESVETPVSAEVDEAFAELRKDWTMPDGRTLNDAPQVWKVARELALGFYYTWSPHPPARWLARRKECSAWIRYILTTNQRELYSELMVVNAIDAGLYPAAEQALREWRETEPTFEPNTVPVWIDYGVSQWCADWAKKAPGIVWSEFVEFGRMVAQLGGLDYYGEQGLNDQGRMIEDHDPRMSMVASADSNRNGRNLQAWNRNLFAGCPPNGLRSEQQIARTHRTGQRAYHVNFEILWNSAEHARGYYRARRQAQFTQDTTGQKQKILYADDLVLPEHETFGVHRPEARWQITMKGNSK